MLSNLAASLIIHGRVKTTDAKAKEVRPFVERLVTFARRGDLHARRIVFSRLRDVIAVKKLFDEIGPQFVGRFGGYTRIVKLGFRPGDNSPVSLIEFVSEEEPKKTQKKKKTTKTKAEKQSEVKTSIQEETASEAAETVEAVEAAPEVDAETEAVEVEEETSAEEQTEKSGDDSEAEKTE